MLLRKITKHVTDQNWFAVFIDFLIVVVGVFIGIQVSNWNASLAEKAKEAVYLSRITEDINADFTEMDLVKNAAQNRIAVIEFIFTEAQLELPRRQFTLLNCVYKPCTGMVTFDPVPTFDLIDQYAANDIITNQPQLNVAQHAYNALISTGDIGLLHDLNIVKQIQIYYSTSLEVKHLEDAIRDSFDQLDQSRHRLGLSAGGVHNDQLIQAVKNDTQFAAQMNSHWYYSGFQIRAMKHTEKLAQALLETLEESR